MSRVAGTVDVYDVTPTPDNRVRLEMVLKSASFPDFAVDFEPSVALRVGQALVANAVHVQGRAPLGMPPQGASHGT